MTMQCSRCGVGNEFIGVFADLQKATISFVMAVRMSVCPSACNNSALTGRIFRKFDTSIFRKYVEKIQVSLQSDKINGHFT
jgi:hypothetical protein